MDREETAVLPQDLDHISKLRILQRQCRGYYELSLLVKAVDALDNWRKVEHEHATKVPRPTSLPAKVKTAFENTCAAVEPVLSGILMHAKDGMQNTPFCVSGTNLTVETDDEAADLVKIRNWFLPEIVLAYNAVLCAAAHMITRDHMLRSMELSTDVADAKTGLAECFLDGSRMRELVISLARASKIMLKLNEMNKGKREKKQKGGKNFAIWEISA